MFLTCTSSCKYFFTRNLLCMINHKFTRWGHTSLRCTRGLRAVSAVLAVLLLVAVAVAGSLVVYAWVMGYIGFSSEGIGEAIKIPSMANDPEGVDLLVYVQNIGDEMVQLEEVGCLYVNGELVPCTISGVVVSEGVATLGCDDTAVLRYVGGAAFPDEKVTVKVTTVRGTSAEKSGYPAGTAYIPSALNHFTFDTVEGPQVSGVGFNVTVWAVDQYDMVFVGYNGANILAYSGGGIIPSVTGNFSEGVWSGEVTVTGSATGATITTVAQVNMSWNGTSNIFDVVPIEPVTLWNRTYGGTGDEMAYALVAVSDGGFALAGYTGSFGVGGADFWLVKTDENGAMEWNITYGGTGDDEAFSLVETFDGGYAVAGYTDSFGAGAQDFWLVKTDRFGNEEWNMTYGGTGDECAYSVVETPDRGYALAGSIDGLSLWLVKTDSSGNMEWNMTYNGIYTHFIAIISAGESPLVATSDGGYALAGSIYSDGRYIFCLIKTDENGTMEWNMTYGRGYCNSVAKTSDGGYMLAGQTPSTLFNMLIVKVDENGVEEWNRTFGEPSFDPQNPSLDEAVSVVETPDGGYLIAGQKTNLLWKNLDLWVIKVDGYGNMQWNQTYGGTTEGTESATAIIETSDGGYAIAGRTTTYGTGNYDFWLIKINGYGNIT